MEDWQLLEDYSRTRSETAFAQLVERHLGLVHSAARRQVDDDALAADVAQAVFLLLARKAGSFGPGSVLVGWLFRTTRFVASRALRAEARRRRREQEAVAMQQLNAAEPHWDRLAPELDEAIAGLGEADRNALLLRFAEGRNHREVGVALGLGEEAAKKRVNRALERLRGRLAAQGVALTVAVLAGCLSDRLCAAPPAGMAARIAHGAVAGVPAAGVAARLAQQAAARPVRPTVAAVCVGVVVLVGALLLGSKWFSGRPDTSGDLRGASARLPAPVEPSGSRPAAQVPGLPPRLTGQETFRLRAVAADSGEPLPEARVLLNFVSNGEWVASEDRSTDADGVCMVPLPRGVLMRMDVGVHFPGHENRFLTWRSDWQQPRPDSGVLRLARAETVGGRVVDAQRRPLAGVDVWLAYHVSDTSWREPEEDRERLGFVRRLRLGVTDAQGRWFCSTIPPACEHFAFEFEHPDHVKDESLSVARGDETDVARKTLALLRSREMVTTMQTGAVAFGQVVDAAGEPVPGARIGATWHGPGVVTDSGGHFTLRSLPRGEAVFVATADGHAPKRFRVEAGGKGARVQLDPGGILRARLVDPRGEPIAGASLVLEDGFEAGALGWDGQTDADGRVVWRSAPPGRTLAFTAHAPGHRIRRQFPLSADASEEHVVVLEPALVVVGRVLDADNGQPVGRFKAIPGDGGDRPDFDRGQLFYGTNGVYQLPFAEMGAPAIRVEAEGYETEVRRPERGPDGQPRCDFRLRRADPDGGVRGVVLNPDGSPAAGAEVVLCTLEKAALLGRGRFLAHRDSIVTHADAGGRFAFPVVRTPHTVAAVSGRGFGRVAVRGKAPAEVRLQPFGAVEGVLLRDGQPQPGKRVLVSDPGFSQYAGAVSLDVAAFEAQTDADGRFRIEHVPAGDLLLYVNPGPGIPFTDETRVGVVAGEGVRVVMGEPDPAGRTVVGRLKPSETVPVADWRRHLAAHSLSRRLAVVEPPAGLSGEALQLWWVAWHQSPAGREQARERVNHTVEMAADGTFTVRGVRPGEYELSITALPLEVVRKGPWEERSAEWRGQTIRRVTVPEVDPLATAIAGPIDLGEVDLKVQRRRR